VARGLSTRSRRRWDDEIKRLSEAADAFERVANVGEALASASTVHWMAGLVGKVIVPVILSPFVDSSVAMLMIIGMSVLRKANPHRVDRGFRIIMRSLR
jgi:hypothetical protein